MIDEIILFLGGEKIGERDRTDELIEPELALQVLKQTMQRKALWST
jgi:hypothetical protein